MKLICCVMFFLVPLFYIGQTKKSDSLKTHILNWKNQTGLKADTMLHKAYKDYGLLFMPDNPDSSNFFY